MTKLTRTLKLTHAEIDMIERALLLAYNTGMKYLEERDNCIIVGDLYKSLLSRSDDFHALKISISNTEKDV